MKSNWTVHAERGNTIVNLPAPRGDEEAHAMAAHLLGFGWHDVKVESDEPIPRIDTPPVTAKIKSIQTEPVYRKGMSYREFQELINERNNNA